MVRLSLKSLISNGPGYVAKVLQAIAIGAVGGALISMSFLERIILTSPRVSDPTTGQIEPYEYKATLFYLTHQQHVTVVMLNWAMVIGGIVVVTGVLLRRSGSKGR